MGDRFFWYSGAAIGLEHRWFARPRQIPVHILALLAAGAAIAFAILYARDKRNASKDELARDDRDDVKVDEIR